MAFWRRSKKESEVRPSEVVSSRKLARAAEPVEKTVPPVRTSQPKYGSAARGVLRWPHITEKASRAGKTNQYVFVVNPKANKVEIARAVETRYGVGVDAIRVITIPGKVRRRGRIMGRKSGYKKAMVTLKEGHTIEIQ